MGVIKKIENLFEIKCSLSEETIYIPSSDNDDEYVNDDDIVFTENENCRQLQRQLHSSKPHLPTIGPIHLNLRNYSGKKKFRRYNTAVQLLTLCEDNDFQEVTINDFMVCSRTSFSILWEDEKCFKKWNDFISSSEECQKELLEKTLCGKKGPRHQPVINRVLRSLLRKKNLPLGMLDYLEQQLIAFFCADPTKTYVSPVLTSFERLLLHSISNYHNLTSLSFTSKPEKVKLVRVKNPRKEFLLPPLLLIQYLKLNYNLD